MTCGWGTTCKGQPLLLGTGEASLLGACSAALPAKTRWSELHLSCSLQRHMTARHWDLHNQPLNALSTRVVLVPGATRLVGDYLRTLRSSVAGFPTRAMTLESAAQVTTNLVVPSQSFTPNTAPPLWPVWVAPLFRRHTRRSLFQAPASWVQVPVTCPMSPHSLINWPSSEALCRQPSG
jgi:hypothetical protein